MQASSPTSPAGTDAAPVARAPRPLARVLAALVVAAAFLVFAAVIWYAYREGRALLASEPPLVTAPPGPYRVEPEERGGMPVVNESAPITTVLEGAREEPPVTLVPPPVTRVAVPEPEPAARGDAGAAGDGAARALAAAERIRPAAGLEPERRETVAPSSGAEPVLLIPPPLREKGPGATPAKGSGDDRPAATPSLAPAAPAPAPTAVSAPTSAPAPPPAEARAPAAAPPAASPREPVEAASADGAPASRPSPVATEETPAAAGSSTAPTTADEAGKTGKADASAGTATESRPQAAAARFWRVQLGAYASRGAALAAWKRARGRFASVIGDAEPVLVPVTVRGRALYRLQFGRFAERTAARRACAAIRGAGGDCLVAGPVRAR